jgi:riboflavin synthase
MFSGIVERIGRVVRLEEVEGWARIVIEEREVLTGLSLGESVAVDGACLTVAHHPEPGVAAFDLMPETLRRSTLGDLQPGSPVNLERSLRVGDRIGGHFVQGHLDGVAEVLAIDIEGEAWVIRFRLEPSRLGRYVVEKGFIAVAGVSLTVVDAERDEFSVSLVRTTLGASTLGVLQVGDKVNIEVDLFARYLVDRTAELSSLEIAEKVATRDS